jgi:flagellar protein FliO/FliZ
MQALTFIFAFVAVLALILLVAWLVRRFAGNRLGTTANRGRMPRLAVIDATAVDGRRRLVLVRRDNVEHLLMIGGPTDIVVESNIVRVASAREQIPQRPGLAAEPASPPRIAPLPDAPAWPDTEAAKADGLDQPEPQITPMPELPTRPLRPAFGDDGRRSMSAMAERTERRGEVRGERREPMGFPPEPLPGRQETRPEPRQEPRNELRSEPRIEPREPRADRLMPRGEPVREPILPRQLRPAEPPKPADPFRPLADRPVTDRPIAERPIAERSIAERSMAEPKAPPMRTPDTAAAPPPLPPLPPAPPVTAAPPQQSAEANLAEMAQRLEAALRRPVAAEPQAPAEPPAPEPPPLRPAARSEPPAATPKTSFENLEDEMASLLGRPKSSS